MTTADKLEAEAKRLRGYVAVRRKHEYTPEMYRAARLAERDEALAAAWRALTAEHEALSLESGDYDHLGDAALRAGCDVCQVLERINALEID